MISNKKRLNYIFGSMQNQHHEQIKDLFSQIYGGSGIILWVF